MKHIIHRFIDWMDSSATLSLAKIICIPGLLVLWSVSIIINLFNRKDSK